MRILTPNTPEYDRARRVFNVGAAGMPAAIVPCADEGDVIAAVRHARAQGWSVAVRGGGHSIAGFSAPDGALVIDLRPMNRIEPATDGGVARVGGGATWGDVLERLTPLGVATPGGFDPRVGVGGLTLGGGYGILSRMYGLACDNLVGADVVLASGERVTADAELLWALRGAGAGFGVVTTFEMRVHALPMLVAGSVTYPLARAPEILRAARDLIAPLPDAATVYCALYRDVELVGFHLGSVDDARRIFAPFVSLGGALRVDFRLADYAAVHPRGTWVLPDEQHHEWRAHFAHALDDATIDAVATHAQQAPGRLYVVIEHLGGAIARVAPDATAFAHREAPFGIISTVAWPPGVARPDDVLATQRSLHLALTPASIGRYVNYVGAGYDDADVSAAYGANLPRLRQLARKYDPDDLFQHHVRFA